MILKSNIGHIQAFCKLIIVSLTCALVLTSCSEVSIDKQNSGATNTVNSGNEAKIQSDNSVKQANNTVAAATQEQPKEKQIKDIVYAKTDTVDLKLDLYLPESTKPVPAIIWLHGGGFTVGDKSNFAIDTTKITSRGYALVPVNYRVASQAIFPAQIQDCKAAVRWLRAHASEYNLDPDHIGAWGNSAGSALASLLGTSGGVKEFEGNLGNQQYSSSVQAVLDQFGPADFLYKDLSYDAPSSPEAMLFGGPPCEKQEIARKASPITHVDKSDPPFLIMHGKIDSEIPYQESEILYNTLQKAGVKSELILFENAGHGGQEFCNGESLKKIFEFFDKYLK